MHLGFLIKQRYLRSYDQLEPRNRRYEPFFQALASIDVDPSARNYTGLGAVLWQQGRSEEAIENLRKAIQIDSKNTATSTTLGKIFVEQGKLEEAAETYCDLSLNMPSTSAHQELVQILTRMGREQEARKKLIKAKALEKFKSNNVHLFICARKSDI